MAQYYFAWVDASETTFDVSHKREDEQIFDFNLRQSEGEFALLDITIINPRIGLLNPGRDIWAWFAYEHPTGGTVPLFFGRLIGIPEDLQEEQVKLSFVARPADFAQQKLALAETLKVRPYWDPIWFSPDTVDDPDNVLESRSAMWHTNRVTGVVSISDIINGEDGDIALGEDDVFYDSVRMHYSQPPARNIFVTASVSWDQKASSEKHGMIDISSRLKTAFQVAGSGDGFRALSYTGGGLADDWPKAGASLGGGWSVGASFAVPATFTYPVQNFQPGFAIPGGSRGSGVPFETFEYDGLLQPHGGLVLIKTALSIQLKLAYDVSRQRRELLSFTLSADVQPILTDPGDEEVINLSMQSSELTSPMDESGLLPIRDQRAASYFSTDRGAQSIEYLLCLARARLLSRARCVFIDLEIPFDDGILLDLSCRKNVIFSDSRLPGGIAGGKVTEYSMSLVGDSGQTTFSITFGATAGRGNTISAVPGEPDYVETDYVEDDYQFFSGQFVMPITGEILYESIAGTLPNDDGINFFSLTPSSIIQSVSVENGANVQEAQIPFTGPVDAVFALGAWSQYYIPQGPPLFPGQLRPEYVPSNAINALNAIPTKVHLTLKNLQGGPFETDYQLVVSDLMIPKLIDLEAASEVPSS